MFCLFLHVPCWKNSTRLVKYRLSIETTDMKTLKNCLWCLVFRSHLVADLLPPFRKPDSREDAENLKVLRGFGAFVTVSNSLSFSQIKLSSQKEEEKCQYNSHGTLLRFYSGYVYVSVFPTFNNVQVHFQNPQVREYLNA